MSASADALSALSLPWYEKIEGSIWNAATGTLSDAQKKALIAQQVAMQTQASGDAPVSTQALESQATADVSAVLTANHADPSQASLFNNPGLDNLFQKFGWIIAIATVAAFFYFLLEALRLFGNG